MSDARKTEAVAADPGSIGRGTRNGTLRSFNAGLDRALQKRGLAQTRYEGAWRRKKKK